jgi:hypothetical protein
MVAMFMSRRGMARVWLFLAAVATLGVLIPPMTLSQVPARLYWKTLSGGNAVPLMFTSATGNTNPFDPAHIVTPGANVAATTALVGYVRTFSLFDRGTTLALLVPVGHISAEVDVAGQRISQTARGFGDPTLELCINLIGPKAQMNLVDVLRYEPGFSLDLIADLGVPIGEYDTSRSLNLGQNRWFGRLGAPIVWQIGPWVPGRRTTLEFLPGVWLFGNNKEYVGQTLTTDPMFQVDAHLTRDFTERLWGALDGAWYKGGKATVDGVEGKELNSAALGFTLGYQINDNLSLTVGYKSTIKDSDPGALQSDGFMVSLVAGWHPLVEGARRLKGEE